MRLLAISIAFVGAAGCSRHPPSEAARPGPAALHLATAFDGADAAAAAVEGPNVHEAPPSESPPLAGKTVLHVGDSMVGGTQGLTRALEQRFTSEGAKLVRDFKVSESIASYDHSPKLKALLAKHHPDIVIVTLGTNDVFVPYPATLAANVQNIVKRIGDAECYWMGPPLWKPDTGIVQVLRDNTAPCKFFDSSDVKPQRARDGIHPTDAGGAEWATSFWTFFRKPAAADAGTL